MIGVRIDIDTLRDVKYIPATLDLLDRHGIKATFFVTTGVDETYRNIKNYLNPMKLLSKKIVRRYGWGMFSGLLSKKEVQKPKELDSILEAGHELGLHGYNHFRWMNHFEVKSNEEITAWISKGCELFETAFGFYPKCFAAPGFNSSEDFILALDEFGFKYSSDYMGNNPFYPEFNGHVCKTLQIPVSLDLGKHKNNIALKLLDSQMADGYSIFYFHPSCEPVFRESLLEKAFNKVADTALPLGELKQ